MDILLPFLSDDELGRADDFVAESARIQYVTARAILRILLSRYLGVDPSLIFFQYNSFGKPSLTCSTLVQFNISHSGTKLLVALCNKKSIGVDIECIGREMIFSSIESLMSNRERSQFGEFPDYERREAFFRWWTRKEAYVKARGTGLSTSLDSFEVDLQQVSTNVLLSDRNDPLAPLFWSVYALDVEHGYVAALAIQSTKCEIKRFDFHGF